MNKNIFNKFYVFIVTFSATVTRHLKLGVYLRLKNNCYVLYEKMKGGEKWMTLEQLFLPYEIVQQEGPCLVCSFFDFR